ncbi:hypothetical protein [Chondrinema litorale]|uniref:hypothetical protein n=1 Tax=Chondrinema litorale TaxID=2994555 RepID=UPI0025435A46|nr:hypothetical protein [Chondrinema litorale]UZR96162.1 hypothetical protein OQ292_10120 [Chondrinema litorale]
MKYEFDDSDLDKKKQQAKKKFYMSMFLGVPAINIFFFASNEGIRNNLIMFLVCLVFSSAICYWQYKIELKRINSFISYYIELTETSIVAVHNQKYLKDLHYSQIKEIKVENDMLHIMDKHSKLIPRKIFIEVKQKEDLIHQLKQKIANYREQKT